jgi:hypothetical protein
MELWGNQVIYHQYAIRLPDFTHYKVVPAARVLYYQNQIEQENLSLEHS